MEVLECSTKLEEEGGEWRRRILGGRMVRERRRGLAGRVWKAVDGSRREGPTGRNYLRSLSFLILFDRSFY